MNFKKRVNGSWVDTPHYIHNTSTDTITTLPAVLYPNAVTATVGLKGDMQQTGSPTPTTPIQPSECGERTGNLFDNDNATIYEAYINSASLWTTTGGTGSASIRIPVNSDVQYTLSISEPNTIFRIYETSNSNPEPSAGGVLLSEIVRGTNINQYTFTTASDTKYLVFQASGSTVDSWFNSLMLNYGSSPLPYENYGYKIPILNNSQTTNVYLGEVQTTRRIKKLVLTGEEDGWVTNSTITSGNAFYNASLFTGYKPSTGGVCTHYKTVTSISVTEGVYWGANINFITSFADGIDTALKWKQYLAQQYANGTPVTVWYVLATPQTAVVNEPLRKIGTYADEVSGISIPTIAGANTLSIGTTLQPSEVTATYKGWHPVQSVHVYPDSSWMPTSWEEFRKAVRSGKAQSLYPVGTKLYENWGDTTSDAWIVVDYPTGEDYLDSDLAQQGYTNRVMLMEEKLNYLRQFDAIEAWLYVETAIPAGTYRFTIPNYDASYGGNKTYIFTSTANVPVGGQLTLTWAYQQNPSAVQAYSSTTSTSALFNVSITEWDGTTACTDLGTIKLAQNDADSAYGKLNHIHRARYGSNNYYQSGYRQWLNTNASANWWTPTNVFDRPYGNRTNAGRLNVMNSNMKSVLATPTVNCITNNLFEYPSLDGTTFSLQTAYTVTDKLFPVTHSEINLSSSPNVNSVLDYYVGKGNADRIKYRKDNGNAYYWWLRTPYPTVAYRVRYVITSGALYYYGAYTTNGSAAACIIQ